MRFLISQMTVCLLLFATAHAQQPQQGWTHTGWDRFRNETGQLPKTYPGSTNTSFHTVSTTASSQRTSTKTAAPASYTSATFTKHPHTDFRCVVLVKGFRPQGNGTTEVSSGSGTIVGRQNNPDGTYNYLVITNEHVVRDRRGSTFQVGVPRVGYFKAVVHRVDDQYDLATLLFDAPDKVEPVPVTTRKVQAGDFLELFGYPNGSETGTFKQGTVKGYARFRGSNEDCCAVVSGHAPGGFSGGPGFDANGNLAAVTWGDDHDGEVYVHHAGALQKFFSRFGYCQNGQCYPSTPSGRIVQTQPALSSPRPSTAATAPSVSQPSLPSTGSSADCRCEACKCDLEPLTVEIDALRQEVALLRSDRESTAAECASFRQEVSLLRQEIERVGGRIPDSSTVNSLSNRVDTLENRIQNIGGTIRLRAEAKQPR